ncbi:MAG: transposase, partial [Rhodobacteraceae bacterium]|nr:transposase [Paracoccaceae bacterium]
RHSEHSRHAQERQSRRSHAHGCQFPFLPPKSPDPNPTEMAFSKLKAHLCRIGARTFTDMSDALAEICELYSPQECWNYFKATGYVSS